MRKRVLTLTLVLALCLGLMVVPARALSFEDAEIYLSKARSYGGASYLVDFDGDGREELLLCKGTYDYTAQIWQGGKKLADPWAGEGTIGSTDLYLAYQGNKVYLVEYSWLIRGAEKWYEFYTVQNGQWVRTSSRETNSNVWTPNLPGYTWVKVARSAKEHSVVDQLQSAATPVAPPLPEVPAAPLGSGLTPAKAEAVATLDNIDYFGDRSAISMTTDQAQALLNQVNFYASSVCYSDPSLGRGVAYAALFDAGAGVPGLFMAKGYGDRLSADTAWYEEGECAIWSFKADGLSLFSPGVYSDEYTLYPVCVALSADTGTHYFPINYGSVSNTAATVVTEDYDDNTDIVRYTVNGTPVTAAQAQAFTDAWTAASCYAYASHGNGMGYDIYNMTPADQVSAALQGFIAAATGPAAPMAYPSTQLVEVDGQKVEFQCYALRDANGFDTNYIKLRDLADILNGTAAQFEVGWNGDITITTGEAYTPNGSEHNTPFSGQRAYEQSAAKTLLNGVAADLDAIVLTDDTGGGYTYYKLRDLGAALGITVDWSEARGIYIETK